MKQNHNKPYIIPLSLFMLVHTWLVSLILPSHPCLRPLQQLKTAKQPSAQELPQALPTTCLHPLQDLCHRSLSGCFCSQVFPPSLISLDMTLLNDLASFWFSVSPKTMPPCLIYPHLPRLNTTLQNPILPHLRDKAA